MRARNLALFATILAACACGKPRTPAPAEIAAADHGPAPTQGDLPRIVRRYLRFASYFDPYNAEVERCSGPVKAWIRNYETTRTADFTFGWKAQCDVNPRGVYGGFLGMRRNEFFIRDGVALTQDVVN